MDKLLLPLHADSSQLQSIKDSLDRTFIIYGPPGTGKSQTITNIIINNIIRGKHILFVCEKDSGLNVIKNHLDQLGLTPFYISIENNNKSSKNIINKIINTLNVPYKYYNKELFNLEEKIKTSIDFLNDYYNQINTDSIYGFSIYDAICEYFKLKDTKDYVTLSETFIYSISKDSLYSYVSLIKEYINRFNDINIEFNEIINSTIKFDDKALSVLIAYYNICTSMYNYLKHVLKRNNIELNELTFFYNLILSCEKINHKSISLQALKDSYTLSNINEKINSLQKSFIEKYNYMPAYVDVNKLEKSINTHHYSLYIKKLFPNNILDSEKDCFLNSLLSIGKLILKSHSLQNKLINIDNKNCAIIYKNSLLLNIDLSSTNFPYNILFDKSFINYYIKLYSSFIIIKNEFLKYFNYITNVQLNTLISKLEIAINNFSTIEKIIKINKIKTQLNNAGIYVKKCTISQAIKSFYKNLYKQFIDNELKNNNNLSSISISHITNLKNDVYEQCILQQKKDEIDAYNMLFHKLSLYKTSNDFEKDKLLLIKLKNNKNIDIKDCFSTLSNLIHNTTPCYILKADQANEYLTNETFDLVIFDEASQLTYKKTKTIIEKGLNNIIVGDDKQLPPTSFFTNSENSYSLLEYAIDNYEKANYLLWHYRSKHESLISFSNNNFYHNNLLTFPTPTFSKSAINFHYIDGVYDKGKTKTNKIEAKAIVDFIIKKLSNKDFNKTIGIIAFNLSQQNCIEKMLKVALKNNGLYDKAYNTPYPIFVKNLENIQGDERDLIIFSIGFAKDIHNKLSLNLGPINKQDGYKRLNVALTRAKENMEIFSGITFDMIDLNKTCSDGIKYLKDFLYYAKNYSYIKKNTNDNSHYSIGKIISSMLTKFNIKADFDIGLSSYKIDVAILDPIEKDKYILAIITDGNNIYNINNQIDRIVIEKELLLQQGWEIYNLSIIDFYINPDVQIKQIIAKINTITNKKFNHIKTTTLIKSQSKTI